MTAIQTQKLTKTFRGKKRTVVKALRALDLDIVQGEVFGFLGPNGAGKSTTIKTLTGQIRPTSGSAEIFGRPVSSSEAREVLGYLPENPSLYDFMTGREYLGFVGRIFRMPPRQVETETQRVLDLLDLADAAKRPIRSYSKGMVQRLGLAQAMLHDPDLYILDEPMSGLDPVGRALVKDIIRDLRQRGKTIFFSTHITADIEAVCDRVGVIVKGRLRRVDQVADILQNSVQAYALSVRFPDGKQEQLDVAHAELKERLEKLIRTGVMIEKIVPFGQDLERYFLEIVDEANAQDEGKI